MGWRHALLKPWVATITAVYLLYNGYVLVVLS
jgi:hypothetical protein